MGTLWKTNRSAALREMPASRVGDRKLLQALVRFGESRPGRVMGALPYDRRARWAPLLLLLLLLL